MAAGGDAPTAANSRGRLAAIPMVTIPDVVKMNANTVMLLFHVGMAKICFRAVNPDNATVTYETLRKESAL